MIHGMQQQDYSTMRTNLIVNASGGLGEGEPEDGKTGREWCTPFSWVISRVYVFEETSRTQFR